MFCSYYSDGIGLVRQEKFIETSNIIMIKLLYVTFYALVVTERTTELLVKEEFMRN